MMATQIKKEQESEEQRHERVTGELRHEIEVDLEFRVLRLFELEERCVDDRGVFETPERIRDVLVAVRDLRELWKLIELSKML